jgi:predicted DNA-binding protein
VVRKKRLTVRVHLALPRVMAEDLDYLLRQDGRSIAEFVRSLISQAVKDARKKIVTPG